MAEAMAVYWKNERKKKNEITSSELWNKGERLPDGQRVGSLTLQCMLLNEDSVIDSNTPATLLWLHPGQKKMQPFLKKKDTTVSEKMRANVIIMSYIRK